MGEQLLFGIAGIPPSSKPRTAEGGIERLVELGISCMEVQFGHRVNMNEPMAQQVGQLAKAKNWELRELANKPLTLEETFLYLTEPVEAEAVAAAPVVAGVDTEERDAQ